MINFEVDVEQHDKSANIVDKNKATLFLYLDFSKLF
jgi:hypothetical protein